MNSIITRIEEIIFEHRLNDAKFEKMTGKSSGYLNTLRKSKKRYPGADFIISIVENFPEYNLNWLLLGEDPKLKTSDNLVGEPESFYNNQERLLLNELERFIRKVVKDEIKEPIAMLHEDTVKLLRRGLNDSNRSEDQINSKSSS